jgi:dihydropteroate synthase
MIALARSNPQSFVVMHHLGIPASSTHVLPEESSAVAILCQWIKDTQQRLIDEGINPNQIIFDPGIGFGKTPKHSIELIQHMEILTALGEKILVGHSKKSFLRELYPHLSDSRVQETLEVSNLLVQKNVAFLRVHDIALHSALIS